MKYLFIAFYLLFIANAAFTQNDTISLKKYLSEEIYVLAVEPKGGILTITGYDTLDALVTRKVLLERNKVLAISKGSRKLHLSFVTIPFKVRSAVDTFAQTVETGLTNAGLGFNFYNYKMERYFASGTKSTHTFSGGILIAPAAIELSPANTRKFAQTTSKQFFLSAALALSYSYNDLTFALIPVGFDLSTTQTGKHWIYKGQRWWGFGIGISSKILGWF